MPTLYDPARHEILRPSAWDEQRTRDTISRIVHDTESRFARNDYWPLHPKDADGRGRPGPPPTPLYHGAAGVIWSLHYLQALRASPSERRFDAEVAPLLARHRAWLAAALPGDETAAYFIGETPILMMAQAHAPTEERAELIATLIDRNIEHAARELMWGAPGTMLAALFIHERFGGERWAELFVRSAEWLWSQLLWSEEYGCHYWAQELYGRRSTYLDAVHGFVATASVLIRGRHLLPAQRWREWERVIIETVTRTASREGGMANWRAHLIGDVPPHLLMQFCHGSPGFVVCLAHFPGQELDELLSAAGEATWAAGPLTKGSNLCHGTGGNGYAFLVLYRRTGDAKWLERARAFAMHGIDQTEADEQRYGQLRYSLWTGDLGFAIYLWDCIRAQPAFPTLDVFFAC